jgi:hypothetical protein
VRTDAEAVSKAVAEVAWGAETKIHCNIRKRVIIFLQAIYGIPQTQLQEVLV